MTNDIAIRVNNLSKCYHIYEKPHKRLLQGFLGSKKQHYKEFWALKDISFEINKGETVGIIGRNGSGKSTLLQMICGTLTPTSGTIETYGRIAALLELGSGFNPEFTGRENVYLNASVLGLSNSEIDARYEGIVAFADIGDFIEQPVKTYSSGMLVRLAFAVQVSVEPDILIIDEALSVGDFFFQQKCLGRIRELSAKGTTLLFVSHDMGTVRDLCPRVLCLKQGQMLFNGASIEGIPLYFKEDSAATASHIQINTQSSSAANEPTHSSETFEEIKKHALWLASNTNNLSPGKLIAVAVLNEQEDIATSFRISDRMLVRVAFVPDLHIVNHIVVTLFDKYGSIKTVTGSLPLQIFLDKKASGIQIFELEMALMIEAGKYGLKVGLTYETKKNQGHILDETNVLGPLMITWDYLNETCPFLGQVGLPVSARYLS